MSGMVLATFVVLLIPQAAPHPSTQTPYSAPAIRPFEPGPDVGREIAEGDGAAPVHRRPLTAPVTVDAYRGTYEVTPTDAETAYEQGLASAEIRTDQTAGPLDGYWRARDAEGRPLFDLVLLDPGGGTAEGGWHSASGGGAAVSENGVLTLEDGGGTLTLDADGSGWRGQWTAQGRTRAVTLSRAD